MRHLIVLMLCLSAARASAQLQCPAPRQQGHTLRELNEAFTAQITEPLIRHNAGGLGPVLWALIAGQARGEGLGGMEKDAAGRYHPKKGFNIWNVQEDWRPGCSDIVEEVCGDGRPLAASKKSAKETVLKGGKSPCWEDQHGKWMWQKVCLRSYPSLEAAADHYLGRRPALTDQLKKMAAGGQPRVDPFLDALVGSAWSSRAQSKQGAPTEEEKARKLAYREEVRKNVDEALRGIVESRDAAERQIAQVKKEIAGWCAEAGEGKSEDRERLKKEQDGLLARIARLDSVCTRTGSDNLDQASARTRNDAIDECRKAPPPTASTPAPAPSAVPPPAGRVEAKRSLFEDFIRWILGEPHYVTPGGTVFSTQHAGEFWLLKSARGAQIQVRQEPWQDSDSVAVISAVAVRAGRRRVGVYAEGDVVRVDGRAVSWSDNFLQQDLGDGHVLGIWGPPGRPEVVAVMWRDGSTLRIVRHGSWIDVDYQVMPGVDTSRDAGLIGGPDSGSGAEQVAAFVEGWRIAPGESLFDYEPGRSAADYDRRDFPRKPAAPAPQALAEARAECTEAGVVAPPALVEACAFDLAMTGDRRFLQSHRLAAPVVRRAAPKAAGPPPARQTGPGEFFPPAFRPDVANAEPLENGRTHTLSIGAGRQVTFLVDVTKPDVSDLSVQSRQLTCLGDAWDGTRPGYQLFDGQGRAISRAMATCTDAYSGPILPGRYYLVVAGAKSGGEVSVKFEPFYF